MDEGGKLTFIPQGLVEDLIAQGLVLREVLGSRVLTDLTGGVLCVAPHGVQVGHAHGFLDGSDVD